MNASTSTLIRQAHAATAEVLDLPLPSARRREQPLPSPAELRQHLPLSAAMAHSVREGRDAIRAVLDGRDPRLLVVIGPCSLHDPVSALEYADRLAELAPQVSDQLLLVMRAYVEKPRTTIGWKGLVYDPQLDGSGDMAGGLELSRRLMLGMLERGLPLATELLQPLVAGYFDDLLGWAAIGARTSESQVHREMVSGLDLPVGFKNGTDGSIGIATDAMRSAAHPHQHFGIDALGRPSLVQTQATRTPIWSCAAAKPGRTSMRPACSRSARGWRSWGSSRASWWTAATPTAARTRGASRRCWTACSTSAWPAMPRCAA